MEGNFPLDGKNRRLRLWHIPFFLTGAFLIGLCGFLRAVDSQTGSELVALLLRVPFSVWQPFFPGYTIERVISA